MSERAVSLGIVKSIRTLMGDSVGTYVGYQPNLQPPPACGEFYISVGQATSSRGTTVSGDVNDRVYTVQICITRRLGYVPYDRLGAEIAQPDSLRDFAGPATPTTQTPPELLNMADEIAGLLIENYDVVNDCNSFIAGVGVTVNGFTEPFHQTTIGPAIKQNPSWVHSSGQSEGEVWSVTITASGIRRLRPLR